MVSDHKRAIIGWSAGIAAILGTVYGVFGWYYDSEWSIWQALHWGLWRQYFAANGWNPAGATPLGLLLIAGLIVGLGYALLERRVAHASTAAFVVAALVAAFSVASWFTNIGAGSASFASKTTVYVENTDTMPTSLKQLVDTSSRSNGECAYVGNNLGVQSCISEKKFSMSWEARTASAQGAKTVLKRASESDQLSYIMEDSLAYLEYDSGAVWSAIRDGQKRQPIVGVVEWDGSGRTNMCTFDGDYELDMAFDGRFGHNLANLIADEYPDNLYSNSDIWGYCKQTSKTGVKEPVIVIPTWKQGGYEHVTTDRFGGLIVITGTPSGKPKMELIEKVETGALPGPVYPASLAKQQRESFGYSAGWVNYWFRDFGYDTISDVPSQSANPSEYLLTASDGRRYWVTPMRPGSTESQQVVAYSVVPADEATMGQLNRHDLYVLNANDGNVVDMQRLYNRVTDAVNQRQPAFFTGEDSSKGTLTEFLPVGQTTWQIYAERGGNVVYKVEIDINDSISPKVVSLSGDTPVEPSTTTPSPGSNVIGCDAPEKLSPEQLRSCIDKLVDELGKRAQK